jgi:hypothetical protein
LSGREEAAYTVAVSASGRDQRDDGS